MLLLSSFLPHPAPQFEGYCWIGSDLIVGHDGAQEYEFRKGRQVLPGHDGCYTVVTREPGGWRVGTDSRGLARLFLYKKGNTWALSSSFYGLVEHLRVNSVALTHVPALLAAFGIRRGFNDQLTSSDTPISDITLLPTFATAIIGPKGVTTEYSLEDEVVSYEEALGSYVSSWRSRLSTLIADQRISIQADLSGGIDSRTVIAFMLADKGFDPRSKRFRIISAPGKSRDFEVASLIADTYNVPLHKQRSRDKRSISPEHALEAWRNDSLGVYLPVYFHGTSFDFGSVHAHGAGGGNFRPYYSGDDIGGQAKKGRTHIPLQHFESWQNNVVDNFQPLRVARPNASPLVLHYREFRNRFHFGHRPHHNIVFSPLESALTDAITDRHDGRDGRQIYFDIMETLAPGLKDLPFDNEVKSPTPSILRNLTVADTDATSPGEVFGSPEEPAVPSGSMDAYAEWVEEGAIALARADVRNTIGETASEKAMIPVYEARRKGARLQAHNSDLLSLSFARAVDFILG